MSKTPEQIQRLTHLITGGIGLAVFLLFTAFAYYQYEQRKAFAAAGTPVTLSVDQTETRCTVEKKSNKQWRVQGIYSCEEAQRIAAEQNGAFTAWRTAEVPYALVSWQVAGQSFKEWMPVAQLSSSPLQSGMQVAGIADPAEPAKVQRPFSDQDFSQFLLLSGVGAGIGAVMLLMGFAVGRWNRRAQERALQAGGTIKTDGNIQYPAEDANGKPLEMVVPAWSRFLTWGAHALLVFGLLFALAAAASGYSTGDKQAMQGAIVIATLSFGIWKTLKYLAKLGVTPRVTAGQG